MSNHHDTLILDKGFEHLYIFYESIKMDDTETVKVYMRTLDIKGFDNVRQHYYNSVEKRHVDIL